MPKLTQPGRAEMPHWQADAQPSNEQRLQPTFVPLTDTRRGTNPAHQELQICSQSHD